MFISFLLRASFLINRNVNFDMCDASSSFFFSLGMYIAGNKSSTEDFVKFKKILLNIIYL